MKDWEAQGLTEAIQTMQVVRTRDAESRVQGEGGLSFVLDRMKDAEEGMHDEIDMLEATMDEAFEEILGTMVKQLTKMEEQQAVVLNANFEALHKYIRVLETKLKVVAKNGD